MQKKIGKDTLGAKPRKATFTEHYKPFDIRWKRKILQILKNSRHPLNVSEVAKQLEYGNWMTVKQALIDLELEGKVEHFRSGRMLLFRLKKVSG